MSEKKSIWDTYSKSEAFKTRKSRIIRECERLERTERHVRESSAVSMKYMTRPFSC